MTSMTVQAEARHTVAVHVVCAAYDSLAEGRQRVPLLEGVSR
jgi:hypothetical protein